MSATQSNTIALLAIMLAAIQPVPAQVLIQEVLYDGPGSDSDDVFTELIGPPSLALDGWSLVGVNGGSGTPYRTVDLTGAIIPPDGVLVVATDNANDSLAAVRDHVGLVDWQNGPDAVQLLDSSGTFVDALQYGDAGPFNAGEGAPAPKASSGKSLSRDGAGTDSDDNLADFTVLEVPSPGLGPTLSGISETVLTVSVPDTTAFGGDTLTVPVRITGTGGLALLAAEMSLAYDGDLLVPIDVVAGDLINTMGWQLASNIVEGIATPIDTVRMALATAVDTLSGAGSLASARFLVADLRRPAATDLSIEHLILNDGGPSPERQDGSVRLVGIDAALSTSPQTIEIHDSLYITITDPDVDRDPERLDTLEIDLREGPEDLPPAQIESLLAVETATSSGIFSGSIALAYADAVSTSDRIETAPRHRIELCFDDALDATGATTRRCTLLAVPAHDGRLDATVVAEPGDTLWMRLIDADLNRNPVAVDSAIVTTIAHVSADTQHVRLVEIGLSDSVFFGHLTTVAVAFPDAPGLVVGTGDTLRPSYEDLTPTEGDTTIVTDTTQVLGHFGDADGNGQLQAFDASRILTHVLAPDLSARDSLAGNLDSLAPFGAITPYDAALILQQRVGLRHRFPVQESGAVNHPRPAAAAPAVVDTAGAARGLLASERRLELRHEDDHLSLWLDDRSGIVAADVLLRWERLVETRFEAGDDLQGFLLASRAVAITDDPTAPYTVRVVLAGPVAATGPGELLRVYPGADAGFGYRRVSLTRSRFNDGRISTRMVESPSQAPARPVAFTLHVNHPNPFNATTVISFELAEAGPARLEVIDLLGQSVRILATEERRAGTHRVIWDGLDGEGRPAATGVYLVRLRAGRNEEIQRMLLLR